MNAAVLRLRASSINRIEPHVQRGLRNILPRIAVELLSRWCVLSIVSRFQSLFGVETKSGISSPEPWLFELFGAGASASGITVTPRVAMTCAPVNCAVRSISESVGQIPLHLYVRNADGTKQRATDHPAYTLLNRAPNDWTSAFEFRQQLTEDALLHHGGFAFINRVDGRPYELIRLRPETVEVKIDETTGEPSYLVSEQTGQRMIARGDMIHIRAPFSHGYRNESLISLAADSIGLALLLERHATRMMANGARPSGVLSVKGVQTADGISRVKAAWDTANTGGNSGKSAIVPAEVQWQPLTFSSVDAQFLEMRKFAVLEIARVFRVPPSMLFALDRVTHSNGEQLGHEFVTMALTSWLKRWEGEIALKLLTPDERDSYYAEFLTDDLVRADLATRTEAQVKQIAARMLSPNEARAQNNMDAYAGGDSYENPNTTSATVAG